MELLGGYLLVFSVFAIVLAGVLKRVPVFDCFLGGAAEGLKSAVKIIPALCALITGVTALRASGIIDVAENFLQPVFEFFSFPAQLFPLAVLRPISGSGSLAVVQDIFKTCGVDSFAGRAASVLMGSTETTFYTIAVYFGAVGIKKSGYTVWAALFADVCGILLSSLAVTLFFPRL